MRHIVLLEHSRLRRDAGNGATALPEGREPTLPRALYDRLRRFDKCRPETERVFTWHDQYARAAQWVGVIQLPGLLLEILPKIDSHPTTSDDTDVPLEPGAPDETDAAAGSIRMPARAKRKSQARDNLLYMLAVAGDVPLRPQEIARLAHRRAALSETLASIFARRLLAEMLRGLARGYLPLEENLRSLKGKLQLGAHLLHNAAHRERFFCQYDNFAEDIPLNRLFRAVCRVLLGISRAAATQDALRHCLLVLDGAREVTDPRGLLEQITLTRQQERFADLFSFARLILEHHAPLPGAGDARCFSLMFDMNIVFERFIAGLLRSQVVPRAPGLRLHVQGRGIPRTHLLETRTGTPTLRLQPDLMLKPESGPPLIIDTKWKRLNGRVRRSGVREEDLYQLYAYTMRFEAARSILLFPRVPEVEAADYRLVAEPAQSPEARREVGVRFVDLHGRLWEKEAREALRIELQALVEAGLRSDAPPIDR